jgi:5'-3' exonuclease
MKEKILVIDSANLYHSRKYDWISGKVSNLIEPFLNDILQQVQLHNPKMVVLCNDEYKSKYRQELTKEYKLGRIKQAKKYTKVQKEAEQLVRDLKKNLKHFEGVFVYGGVKDVEADDIMSILYHDKRLSDYEIIVVSQDKDLMTTIPFHNHYDWTKGRFKTKEDRLGFSRQQFLGLQALMGDGVDGVSSVKGVGVGTAEKIIRRFGSLKNLLETMEEEINSEDIQKDWRVRKALERLLTKEGKDELKLGYKLVKIMKDKSLLEDYQEREYENVVQKILNFKKPKELVTDELDDIFFESQAFKAKDYLEEIAMYLN